MPDDLYQCAKVAKILQMLEQGNVTEFQDKSLADININMNVIEEHLLEDVVQGM